VSIFFGELKYTEITEERLMNPSSFAANLGGVFGLCSGMSVVTIVQALAYCVEYVLNKLKTPAAWENVKRAVEGSGYVGRLDWHGLLDLYLAKTLGWRLFWVAIVLGSCATFTFYCNEAYQEFMYNNTATGLSITSAKSAPFPYIRFCHKEGRHNLTYIQNFLKSQNLTSDETTSNYLYRLLSLYSNPNTADVMKPGVIGSIPLFMKLFGKNNMYGLNLASFLVESSYSCQQTFASCTFNSEPFDCCVNAHSYYNILGFCHQLDFLNAVNQQSAGSNGGAGIHVKLHRDEFLRSDFLIHNYHRSYDTSLIMYFSESEKLSLFDESILLAPGTRNRIRLETEEFQFIPGSEKKCDEVPPLLHVFDGLYTEELCYMECVYNTTQQGCGCDLPMYSDGKNISLGVYCTPLELAACMLKYFKSDSSEDSKQAMVIVPTFF
jgi:Amiloride-sensitive sodium channel